MRNIWLSLLLIFLTSRDVTAEIEEVTVTWNAFTCQGPCLALINQNFKGINGVKNLQVDPSGTAVMKWDSAYPFTYEAFRYASKAVGIHIRTMRVKVKGKVLQEGKDLFLVSSKDNTRFFLIGPVKAEPGRYAPTNIALHPLTPGMIDTLMDAEKRNSTISIEGPLFLPGYHKLALIAERIKG